MEFVDTNSDLGRGERIKPVSTAKFCLICLATDCKLYPLSQYSLGEAYQRLTGTSLQCNMKFAKEFCTECAQRLINCNKFRDKSLRSYNLLLELFESQQEVTTYDITINRTKNKLTSNITKKVYQPDHCDLHYIHNEFEHVKIELEIERDTQIDVKPKVEAFNTNSDDDFLIDDNDCLYNDTKHVNDTDVNVISNDLLNQTDNIKSDIVIIDDKRPNNKKNSTIDAKKVKAIKKDKTKLNAKSKAIKKDKITINVKKRKSAVKEDKAAPKKKNKNGEESKAVKSENKEYLKYFIVTELSHEEQLATIQRRQESENFKNCLYKCMTCYKGFMNVTTYNTHLEKHSEKYGQFVCVICGLRCKKSCKVRDHVVKNHSQRYSCNVCPLVTTFKKTAQNHALWHDGITFKCELCNEEYNKRTSYLSHLRVRHPTDVVCTICGFSFVNERGLRMHTNLKHRSYDLTNPSGPQCEPCNIRFVSRAAYQQHLDVSPKHSNKCLLKRNAPKKIYDKQFTTKPKEDNEIVVCEQCNMQFEGFKMYASHFKRYHSDKKRTQYPPHSPQRFLCDQCARSFKNLAALKDHMLMHTGTKKYECDLCNKKFYLKNYLMMHIKAHSDACIQNACPICGKNFVNKANRNRHMWTHRDLKPFECDACDKTYVNASALRSHVLHAHLKQPWPKKSRAPHAARSAMESQAGCGTTWPKTDRAMAVSGLLPFEDI